MPFQFEKINIDGLILIKPKTFIDERGFFLEIFKNSDFEKYGIKNTFFQDNFSYSKKNVIRGLHFQTNPYKQDKLVKVIKGEVLDVVVDLRNNSKTFKKWFSVVLSDKNNHMLFIPAGCAHGFAVLSDDAYFLYKCTKEYSPTHESGIRYDDPDLSIDWKVSNPIVSEKDLKLPYFKETKII